MSEEMEESSFTLASDYDSIEAACSAYRLVMEVDTKLMDEDGQEQVERIKENSLFIIDKALQFLKAPYIE